MNARAFLVWLLAPVGFAQAAPAATDDTDAALRATLHRYVLGYYRRDPALVLETLHPRFLKVGVGTSFLGREVPEYLSHLTHDQIEPLARLHNADGRLRETDRNEVVIHHSTGRVALASVYGADFMDHFQLARLGDEWRIVNGVFGPLPEQPARLVTEEDLPALRALGSAYAAGDARQNPAWLHPEFVRRHIAKARGELRVSDTPAEWLDAVAHVSADKAPGEGAAQEAAANARSRTTVQVVAAQGSLAALILRRDEGVEYLHCVRLGGVWRAVHSLADSAD